jgi:hypothetical protein
MGSNQEGLTATVAAAHNSSGGGKRDGMVTMCDISDVSTAVAQLFCQKGNYNLAGTFAKIPFL